MDKIAKLKELEKRIGGPVKAATAVGVQYPTWYRWTHGKRAISDQTIKLVEFLLEADKASNE